MELGGIFFDGPTKNPPGGDQRAGPIRTRIPVDWNLGKILSTDLPGTIPPHLLFDETWRRRRCYFFRGDQLCGLIRDDEIAQHFLDVAELDQPRLQFSMKIARATKEACSSSVCTPFFTTDRRSSSSAAVQRGGDEETSFHLPSSIETSPQNGFGTSPGLDQRSIGCEGPSLLPKFGGHPSRCHLIGVCCKRRLLIWSRNAEARSFTPSPVMNLCRKPLSAST
jgi:hypothetical protein